MKVVHVHIPKTAGKSIRALMLQHYGSRMCQYRFHTDLMKYPYINAYSAYSGHRAFTWLHRLHGDVSTFTLLRHPYERLVSLYSYWKREGKLAPFTNDYSLREAVSMSFDAWIETEHGRYSDKRNGQAYELAGLNLGREPNSHDDWYKEAREALDRMHIVGTFERLHETVTRLTVAYGWRFASMPHHNASNGYRVRFDALSDATKKRVAEINEIDMALWEWAMSVT